MCRYNFGYDIMHICQDIKEIRCFSNGGTNLHIHTIAQGRPEDNQVEFLQGPHGIINPPKNLVLNKFVGSLLNTWGQQMDYSIIRKKKTCSNYRRRNTLKLQIVSPGIQQRETRMCWWISAWRARAALSRVCKSGSRSAESRGSLCRVG